MGSELQTWEIPAADGGAGVPSLDPVGSTPVPSVDLEAESSSRPPQASAREVRTAMGNAFKLSMSLFGTILVHLAVRPMIARYLGPAHFGQLSFADAYAATFFSFASFGVDTYIRKEVATRLEHANDFYAGFFLLRLMASAGIAVLMALGLWIGGKDTLTWELAYIFAVGRMAYIDNQTVSAFLQAASEVNEVSWMNFLSKVIWGVSIAAGLLMGSAALWVAVCFFISETIKAVYLIWVLHKKMRLRWLVNMRATFAVVQSSWAYFLNNVALMVYAQLNVILLSNLNSNPKIADPEVGWYAATMQIAQLSGFFVPVMQAVVMPMAARTAKESIEAMNEVMRGTMRLVIAAVTLLSLVLMLNAELVARYAFGHAYGQAAMSLRMIAPMFPLTYVATIASLHLIQQGRNWTLLRISVFSMLLNPLVNAPLILWGYRMGPGWAGSMSALATVFTEVVTVVINLYLLGRAAVDARLWQLLGRTAIICATVVAMHMALQSLGIWRIPLEIIAYTGLAVLLKTLPLGELRRMMGEVRRRRQA